MEWRDFTPAPRPQGMRKRADRSCYLNALKVVLATPSYTYAEGIAWSEDGFAVHHAWVGDANRNAIDPTWWRPGTRYFGTTFQVGDLPNPGGPAIEGTAEVELYIAAFR